MLLEGQALQDPSELQGEPPFSQGSVGILSRHRNLAAPKRRQTSVAGVETVFPSWPSIGFPKVTKITWSGQRCEPSPSRLVSDRSGDTERKEMVHVVKPVGFRTLRFVLQVYKIEDQPMRRFVLRHAAERRA